MRARTVIIGIVVGMVAIFCGLFIWQAGGCATNDDGQNLCWESLAFVGKVFALLSAFGK